MMNIRMALRVPMAGLLALSLGGCAGFGESLSTGFGLWGGKEGAEKPLPLAEIKPSASINTQWRVGVGSAGDYVFSPAVDGDSVYAAGVDGNVARFDAESGKQLWRVETGKKLSAGVGVGSGLVLMATRKGEVLAYDPDGKALWQSRVSSEVLSAPQVAEGIVVVRAADGQIYGLDARNGKSKWVYQRALPSLAIRSHAGVVVMRGGVFAGYAGGKLVALSLSNGVLGWEASVAQPRGATELERIADVTSQPVADGSSICAVAFQGRVACFEIINGNLIWAREMSSISGLSVDASSLYVSDARGAVHALDKSSGASLWKQDKLLNRRLSAPVVIGKHVAVADLEGYVHFLSREDGSFAARAATDGSAIAATPLLLGQNLLLQTRNGGLFALAAQ
ncbi:MAG: outer membrane protein assembly factor BamB [Polaromonas sp.]|jgi:outer membrane protein assembly factor BamB|uniref:outer membrane protein assembly factor BamB n=1 Tax=Polaromonas sp. TaxID=1869339 RepID=UPI00272051E8|nr:outer membrane protein assembly factor BamB [Polaromonas sp.]MDO9188551.1 outer membrane protein assembly factor BamB [Sulfurimicrobium sp.]MDO9114422.1 outer membrane protein assembly factor BamB [Polaromonas sp.]MDP1703114.1 outer membrane protein assembly factor BamB [Sulfurimicrobium sp.]MDP1897064.1 outer membrane protein assembly factor BamB [Sulfurimicrobium sp.]MDP2198982.1 outer membrane protein assembly factor BamB [Sulfurimicrobium sp.]